MPRRRRRSARGSATCCSRKGGLWLGVGISAVLAVGSIVLVVVVVITGRPITSSRMAAQRGAERPRRHLLAAIGKNVAGVVLVLLGLVMALPGIPGQGILTMIVGHHADRLPGQARASSAG